MNAAEVESAIEILHTKYGISPLLTESLTANAKEAESCISFFKLMMYLYNGGFIIIGFVMVWYGLTHISYVGYGCICLGVILVIYMTLVLIRQLNVVQAMNCFVKDRWGQ